jgi:hypothetical protein
VSIALLAQENLFVEITYKLMKVRAILELNYAKVENRFILLIRGIVKVNYSVTNDMTYRSSCFHTFCYSVSVLYFADVVSTLRIFIFIYCFL